MHDLTWFQERKGKTIKRIRTTAEGEEKEFRTPLSDDYWVQRCYELQSDTIRFEDNNPRRHGYKGDPGYKYDPFQSDQPVVRIHQSGLDDTCHSCEG